MNRGNIKDACAVSLVGGSAVFFGLATNSANKDTWKNAGKMAAKTAIAVAPVAGGYSFVDAKRDNVRSVRDAALENTLFFGALITAGAAVTAGLTRLMWDWMRL